MSGTFVDPIAALSSDAYAAAEAAAIAPNELGRDEFLKLLVAKMEHQDPLSPTQDTEFISQLATFSSLEQLISVNDNLSSLALGQGSLINSQALNLIGKEALMESDYVMEIKNGEHERLVYAIPSDARQAVVTIHNPNGSALRDIVLDTSEGGRGEVIWDGLDNNKQVIPDGEYIVSISAMTSSGEPVDAALFDLISIDGVNFLNGGITLVSRNQEIPFESVLEIRAAGQ